MIRALVRLVLGGGVLSLAFAGSRALEQRGLVGVFNMSALLLVVVGPWGVALVAYEVKEILRHVRAVGRSLASSAGTRSHGEAFVAMAQAKKAQKLQDLAGIADGAALPEVKAAALLLVKRYDRAALRESLLASGQLEIAAVRRGEDFFLTMARAAPAFGLIGTILGFIDLLGNLSDATKLGPGMALALTATLYGIATSYCVYHPLAKTLATHAKLRAAQWRAAEQAALCIFDERGPTDVQAIWEQAA